MIDYLSKRYSTQDILVHEFAHGIHLISHDSIGSGFSSRLESLYRDALSKGPGLNRLIEDEFEFSRLRLLFL